MQISAGKVVIGNAFGESADLRLLLRLRTIAIVGQTLTLLVTGLLVDIDLPYLSLAAGVVLLAALNLLTWLRLNHPHRFGMRRMPSLDNRTFFYQILVDIAVLTFLLFLAGGPFNPFHDMYLLPLTIAAAALPPAYVWRVVVISLGCYTWVAFYYVPLSIDLARTPNLYIFSEWFNQVILAILISYFGLRIARGVRHRDHLIEEAHAKELRNGAAVAVGSVAAGVAHELGSPLSTISIVLSEMRAEYKNDQEIGPSLAIMANSLDACKQTLGGLRTFVQSLNRADGAISVDTLIENVIDRYRNIRPGVTLKVAMEGPRPAPLIHPDLALQQAIMNLLNNAGDVSQDSVQVEVLWDDNNVRVRVIDQGPGISPELADKLGEILVTTKPPEKGTGLGLFLTNITMHRLGGKLRLSNCEGGGACAELLLPLSAPALYLDTQ